LGQLGRIRLVWNNRPIAGEKYQVFPSGAVAAGDLVVGWGLVEWLIR